MPSLTHIPHLRTIGDFYRQLRIGLPQGDDFAMMRIEDQPTTKLLEMPLFRCNFYRVVLFLNQGVHFNLPEQKMKSGAYNIYFSYPGKIESWLTVQNIRGYLICFTEDFARFSSVHSGFEKAYPFFQHDASSMLCSGKAQLAPIIEGMDRMLLDLKHRQADTPDLLRYQLLECLLRIKRLYEHEQAGRSTTVRNDTTIYHRFRSATEAHFLALAEQTTNEQASVRQIARELLLHPSYLNTVIKRVTGNTASHFLQTKTLLESKSYLQHTDLQVAEIAFRLGFNSVPYFNRFFKKQAGITPSNFRKNL